MQLTGTLKLIQPTQQVSDKFNKRGFVIETLGEYPQTILLELQGAKVDAIDGYKIGQKLTCGIDIRGRAWTNPEGQVKYFNTIVCWKISAAGQAPDPVDDGSFPF